MHPTLVLCFVTIAFLSFSHSLTVQIAECGYTYNNNTNNEEVNIIITQPLVNNNISSCITILNGSNVNIIGGYGNSSITSSSPSFSFFNTLNITINNVTLIGGNAIGSLPSSSSISFTKVNFINGTLQVNNNGNVKVEDSTFQNYNFSSAGVLYMKFINNYCEDMQVESFNSTSIEITKNFFYAKQYKSISFGSLSSQVIIFNNTFTGNLYTKFNLPSGGTFSNNSVENIRRPSVTYDTANFNDIFSIVSANKEQILLSNNIFRNITIEECNANFTILRIIGSNASVVNNTIEHVLYQAYNCPQVLTAFKIEATEAHISGLQIKDISNDGITPCNNCSNNGYSIVGIHTIASIAMLSNVQINQLRAGRAQGSQSIGGDVTVFQSNQGGSFIVDATTLSDIYAGDGFSANSSICNGGVTIDTNNRTSFTNSTSYATNNLNNGSCTTNNNNIVQVTECGYIYNGTYSSITLEIVGALVCREGQLGCIIINHGAHVNITGLGAGSITLNSTCYAFTFNAENIAVSVTDLSIHGGSVYNGTSNELSFNNVIVEGGVINSTNDHEVVAEYCTFKNSFINIVGNGTRTKFQHNSGENSQLSISGGYVDFTNNNVTASTPAVIIINSFNSYVAGNKITGYVSLQLNAGNNTALIDNTFENSTYNGVSQFLLVQVASTASINGNIFRGITIIDNCQGYSIIMGLQNGNISMWNNTMEEISFKAGFCESQAVLTGLDINNSTVSVGNLQMKRISSAFLSSENSSSCTNCSYNGNSVVLFHNIASRVNLSSIIIDEVYAGSSRLTTTPTAINESLGGDVTVFLYENEGSFIVSNSSMSNIYAGDGVAAAGEICNGGEVILTNNYTSLVINSLNTTNLVNGSACSERIIVDSCNFTYSGNSSSVTFVIANSLTCLQGQAYCIAINAGQNISIDGMGTGSILSSSNCTAFYFSPSLSQVSISSITLGNGLVANPNANTTFTYSNVNFTSGGQLLNYDGKMKIYGCTFNNFIVSANSQNGGGILSISSCICDDVRMASNVSSLDFTGNFIYGTQYSFVDLQANISNVANNYITGKTFSRFMINNGSFTYNRVENIYRSILPDNTTFNGTRSISAVIIFSSTPAYVTIAYNVFTNITFEGCNANGATLLLKAVEGIMNNNTIDHVSFRTNNCPTEAVLTGLSLQDSKNLQVTNLQMKNIASGILSSNDSSIDAPQCANCTYNGNSFIAIRNLRSNVILSSILIDSVYAGSARGVLLPSNSSKSIGGDVIVLYSEGGYFTIDSSSTISNVYAGDGIGFARVTNTVCSGGSVRLSNNETSLSTTIPILNIYNGTECRCLASTTCSGKGVCSDLGTCECYGNFSGNSCNACPANYFGSNCSLYCDPVANCSGKGVCTEEGMCLCSGNFTGNTCNQCTENYYGSNCTTLCSSSTCGAHGRCNATNGGCDCDIGYFGADCSRYCESNTTCNGNGNCTLSGECNCNAGFLGTTCSATCSSNSTCGNGTCTDGHCVCKYGYGGATCDRCAPFFHGSSCQFYCDSKSNCSDHGTCVTSNNTCSCNSGYYGERCEIYCDVSNCSSHGICSSTGKCICNANYYGNHCEIQDVCSKCNSNAYCTKNSTVSFCTCRGGFSGDGFICTDINECATPNMCSNNMYCINTPGSYTCSPCPSGFRSDGTNCIDIDECSSSNRKCDYHVTCQNTNGSYVCGDCPTGMEGSGYTTCTSRCGNGKCESEYGEDCVSCKADCRQSPCGKCGDGYCDASIKEDCSCAQDCGLCGIKTCPGSPSCSGHGTCLPTGVCACDGSWTGPECNKENVPIVTNVSITNPGIVITPSEPTQTAFNIILQQLLELDASGNEIYSIHTEGMNFTLKQEIVASSLNQQWDLNFTLENQATLLISIFLFGEEATPVTFANRTTTYAENTIKLQVEVRNWPFRSIQNSLSIVFATQTTSDDMPDDNCNNYLSSEDSNGNLNWISVYIDGIIMYIQYEPYAMLDGSARLVKFYQRSDRAVVATIPHFWETMVLDPSYRVLLGEPECEDSLKSSNFPYITVVIAVPAGVVAAIIVTIFVITVVVPKASLWHKVRSEQKLIKESEMHGMGFEESLSTVEVHTAATL